MEQSNCGFSFANGESAEQDQMVVLVNDPTGEKCGAGTIISFDRKTADFEHATIRWDSDNKLERVLLSDLMLAPVNEQDGFDMLEAEYQDYS